MIFGTWFKRRRRRKLLSEPFPDRWRALLNRNVFQYSRLSAVEQEKLKRDLQIFIAEKNWVGCGGLAMSDEIQVTIGGQVCLLLVGIDDFYFDHVLSVLVYPSAYVAPGTVVVQGGLILQEDSAREGEAWHRGPVILSWKDSQAAGRNSNSGNNVVLHEFAHQLDMLGDEMVDGTPPLPSAELSNRWRQVMEAEYERLRRDFSHGRWTLLNSYGTSNEGEFFAVATECFFQQPRQLARRHPQLYELLGDFYRQDPAGGVAESYHDLP